MSNSRVILSARGITKDYHKDGAMLSVLKGVDIDIRAGDYITIMGPSGAGKSTFLHILGAIDRPSNGCVLHGGKIIHDATEQEQSQFRNQRIGFVFQFYHLLQDFNVLENIMLPLWIAGVKPPEALIRAEEFLDIMGLNKRGRHKPGELSGGEQQRVAIARALINKPELILADEPTGNLDRKTGSEVLDYILSVRETLGSALVLVTHDPEIGHGGTRKFNMIDGELFPLP
jgi:lipoprotein-releasing system ATP-binding protein